MTSRFRVLAAPILLDPIKTTNIVLCICALHNFLIDTKSDNYFNEFNEMQSQENGSDENQENQMELHETETNNELKGNEIRAILTDYFVNEGELHFQYENI